MYKMNLTDTRNIEKLKKSVPCRILNSDGVLALNQIFNDLQDDSTSSTTTKTEIVNIVLKTMRKESCSLTHCADIISRLCLEFPKSPIEHIAKWCDDSIQSIIADDDVNTIWQNVLPECLNILLSHDVINHSGTDISSAEYMQQCVHTLCECQWRESQLVQLATMFTDMQLSRNDHKKVVNKLCSCVIDISPDTLPPLVHQLLRLCKSYNFEVLLAHLSHYFNVRLYMKLEPQSQDSECTSVELDDNIPHSPMEVSRCLSTCLYHITQGTVDPGLVQKHIKVWPKTQLLRSPFIVSLALALSDKDRDFKTVCLNVIKSAIEQRIMDEQRNKESAWIRSVLPYDVDVSDVLKVLTMESANHQDLTVMGLINLAFSLLSTPRTKQSSVCCWLHGKSILVRLCKVQSQTAAHVLSLLGDKLARDCTQRQYTECLYTLCREAPLYVERCSQLIGILESCLPVPPQYHPAAAVLDAVHPLINYSTRTRDALVMICRKGLFSRDSLHRCLALSGFLTLLRHIKLGNSSFSTSLTISSDEYNESSYLTQVTLGLQAARQGLGVTSRVRNEIVCMEVVSILHRCFVQDAAVKQLLYTQIYHCTKNKPILHEPILEKLYEILNSHLSPTDSLLVIDDCVQLTADSAVLREPIGHLLYAIAEFLQPSEEDDLESILTSQTLNTSCDHWKSRFSTIMEQFCNNGLPDVDMRFPGLTDLSPESKAKYIKVQLMLQCYEALIAHQIMQWNPTTTNASTVTNLHKKCIQLIQQTVSPLKVAKKGTQTKKGSNLAKNRAGPFKPLPCLWRMKCCLRILELLYNEEVPWSSVPQYIHLRSFPEFHQWSLRCIHSVLTNEHIEKRVVKTHVVNIATVLYRRCIFRIKDLCTFDDETALWCVKIFKECLSLLFSTKYSLTFGTFLPILTGLINDSPSIYIAAVLETLLSTIVHIEEESTEKRDVIFKKLYTALVQTISLLLEVPLQFCRDVSAVIVKLEEYVCCTKLEWIPMLPALLTAGCRQQQEAPLLDDLLSKLASVLGTTDVSDDTPLEEIDKFPTINSRNGQTVLNHVYVHLMNRFKCVEHVLARGRDLAAAANYVVRGNQERIDKEVNELYKSVVVHMCELTTWTSRCCRMRCAVGIGSDRAVTACERLHMLLATLARQLPPHIVNNVRFEYLLKLSGKKLSSVMNDLIIHLNGSKGTHKAASEVLRDAKLIPKMVQASEEYMKNVILLDNKVKLNYQQYLSLGKVREFHIDKRQLHDALNAMECENSASTDDIVVVSNDGGSDGDDEDDVPIKRRKIT